MKQQLTPKSLKKGSVLYRCIAGTDADNKRFIQMQEWVVRSIQRKRGSQSRLGRAYMVMLCDRDDRLYVNITERYLHVTVDKKGNWLKSIPSDCRAQFKRDDERLPKGYYTTQEQAVKYAIQDKQESLATYKQWLEDEKGDPEETELNQECVDDATAELRLLKSRLTKLKNQKV